MNRIFIGLFVIAILQFSVGLSYSDDKPIVIFDEGHGQLFAIDNDGDLQLSKLAGIFRSKGTQVSKIKETINDDSLKGASALVISGLFKPLQYDEVEAIVRFIQKGGRLSVMMHIAPPLSNLIRPLGLTGLSKTVLHERQNVIDEDINFRVKDLSSKSLFAGIDSFAAYGVWAINPGDKSSAIARTSPTAWMDLNNDSHFSKGDPEGAFAVVVTGSVGTGSFVIFGDDAIFQNRFLEGNNQKLAENLANWLIAK